MWQQLFRRKTADQIALEAAEGNAGTGSLRKVLTVRDLTFMGIAAVVGAGIFSTIGKASFAPEQLAENFEALKAAVEAAKPETAKGQYVRTIYLTSTMGPSVRVALAAARVEA